MAENCKKKTTHNFSLFKGNNSAKKSSDNFDLTFVGFKIWMITTVEGIWLNQIVLEIYEKNLLTDPFVIFIVTVTMFMKNIYTKFNSNWTGSFRKDFFKEKTLKIGKKS